MCERERVCVSVCVCKRERECVCVFMHSLINDKRTLLLLSQLIENKQSEL